VVLVVIELGVIRLGYWRIVYHESDEIIDDVGEKNSKENDRPD
jgi:hypothetical protein